MSQADIVRRLAYALQQHMWFSKRLKSLIPVRRLTVLVYRMLWDEIDYYA